MFGTIAGRALMALTLTLPRNGRWTATFALEPDDTDTEPNLSGTQRLELNDGAALALDGRFFGKLDFGVVVGTGAGGKGDIAKPATPKHYRSTTVKRVLQDLCDASGDTLASDCDPGLLAQQLSEFSVMNHSVGASVARLLYAAGDGWVWRFKLDGSLWCGKDSFREFTPEWALVTERPIENAIDISTDSGVRLPLPGEKLDGRNIESITVWLDAGGMRVRVFFGEGAGGIGTRTVGAALRRLITGTTAALDYGAHYSGQVAKQNDDGTLDVKCDDARLPGFQHVRVKWGAPGVIAKLKANAPCTIGWENGDPTRPYVSGFAPDAFDEVWLAGATASGNFVALANLVKTRLDALQTAINSHTHAVSTTGTATAQSGTAAPTTNGASGSNDVASAKVRST